MSAIDLARAHVLLKDMIPLIPKLYNLSYKRELKVLNITFNRRSGGEKISIERLMEKYREAIQSDVFASYEKEFAQRTILALSKGYLRELYEPPLVQIIEDVVNNVHNLSMRNHTTHFELFTKSVFVHGYKSQVEFDFYGKIKQRELCDLIFIISVVFNGRKYFEKFTLNQFKKDKRGSGSIAWSLSNREQLYLLSRFPSFRGVKGSLIPMKDYKLPDCSGCLGSYGLLYKPGDFAFVSATRLESFIGDKKTLKMVELYRFANERVKYLFNWFPIFYPFRHVFGNSHFSHNVFNFVHEYLRINIGEPVFMKIGIDNPQARDFLDELMSVIESKAKKEGDKRILSFIKSFRRVPYVETEGENRFNKRADFDFEGGGIGIIHTTINLGE